MTWNTFRNIALNLGYEESYIYPFTPIIFRKGKYTFKSDGSFLYEDNLIAENRTREQIVSLMEALS